VGLVIPAAFASIVPETTGSSGGTQSTDVAPEFTARVTSLSRATAIVLVIAYAIYVYFQMSTHHNLISEVLEADEEKDLDRERDLSKKKLTLTEVVIVLLISLACVAMIAVFLVSEIEFIVHERGISDMFMGLILVPLVEKISEHLTALDEVGFYTLHHTRIDHIQNDEHQTNYCQTILGLGQFYQHGFIAHPRRKYPDCLA